MLQAILDGQVALREDLKAEIRDVKDEVRKNGERIDKIGAQLAYLEDDAPNYSEFVKLKRKVKKIEKDINLLQNKI